MIDMETRPDESKVDPPWAILNKYGLVHRTDEGCVKIKAALSLGETVKPVTVNQVWYYRLPPCPHCWGTMSAYTAAIKEAMTS